jgi:hypothetical protein
MCLVTIALTSCYPSTASLEREAAKSINDDMLKDASDYSNKLQECRNMPNTTDAIICEQKARDLYQAQLKINLNGLRRLCKVTHPQKITCYDTSRGMDCEIPRDPCQ